MLNRLSNGHDFDFISIQIKKRKERKIVNTFENVSQQSFKNKTKQVLNKASYKGTK